MFLVLIIRAAEIVAICQEAGMHAQIIATLVKDGSIFLQVCIKNNEPGEIATDVNHTGSFKDLGMTAV